MVWLVAWMQRSKCKITWAKASLQMSNVAQEMHKPLPSHNHWSTVPYNTANPSAIGRCSLSLSPTDRLTKGLHLSLYVSLSKHQSILHQPIWSSIRPESLSGSFCFAGFTAEAPDIFEVWGLVSPWRIRCHGTKVEKSPTNHSESGDTL